MSKMPILQKVLQGGDEVYLPDLQILPGKVEFSYLPINAQSLVILPFATGGGSAVVVATNQAKVMKVADLGRLRALTAILRLLL